MESLKKLVLMLTNEKNQLMQSLMKTEQTNNAPKVDKQVN